MPTKQRYHWSLRINLRHLWEKIIALHLVPISRAKLVSQMLPGG